MALDWFMPVVQPTIGAEVNVGPAFFVDPVALTLEAQVDVVAWFVQAPDPVRAIGRNIYGEQLVGESLGESALTLTPFGWNMPTSAPVLAAAAQQPGTEMDPDTNYISVSIKRSAMLEGHETTAFRSNFLT